MGAAALPVAMGAQAAGAIYAADSEEKSGLAQEGYYRHLARQSRREAELARIAGERQAHDIQDSAYAEYGRLKRGQRTLEGTQRAVAAANGAGGGATAEDIARDTADKALLDEMAIRFNADTQADEKLRQAGLTAFNLRSQADSYEVAGGQARLAAKKKAFATLLGGATSIASTYALSSRGPSNPTEPRIQTKTAGAPAGAYRYEPAASYRYDRRRR